MKKKIVSSIVIALIVTVIISGGVIIASIFIGGDSINLQKGLVGWWKFDGNAKDSTPNSNHGTVTGATLTTDRKGQTNKAYSFNGSTDYVIRACA